VAEVALSAHFLVPAHSLITKTGQEPQSERDSATKSSTAADDCERLHIPANLLVCHTEALKLTVLPRTIPQQFAEKITNEGGRCSLRKINITSAENRICT
jgi:hypothetical protein